MCHGDHPHTVTSPAAAGHANNVFLDATTQATRAVTATTLVGTGGTGTQNRARTDFDTVLNVGLCASCHQKPIVANGITVSAANFGSSAHDFSSNTVGATSYTWSYALHDGSSFARNCTKCHASRVEGNTPASTTTLAVHYSTTDANLLAGTTNPAGTAANFACYNCHGSTATPAAGAQGNRSGKDIQTQILHATTANQSGHPSNSDTRHNSAAEFTNAAFGNALGVTAGAGQRHASCMDCHDPTRRSRPGSRTSPAADTACRRTRASGRLGRAARRQPRGIGEPRRRATSPRRRSWRAPTWRPRSASSATPPTTGTLPTSPSSSPAFAETDQAKEFNPANVSFHPVPGRPARQTIGNTGNVVAPWTRTSLMTCTDCHESDATTDPNGPHGARQQVHPEGTEHGLEQHARQRRPEHLHAASTFCLNCHANSASSSRFPDHANGSTTGSPASTATRPSRTAGRAPASSNPAAGVAMALPAVAGWDGVAPYWQGGTADRLYLKSYPSGNTSSWQKSNCGCNGTGH